MDIGIGLVAKGGLELGASLSQSHGLVVLQALQLVEGGADEHRDMGREFGERGLEGLLQQGLAIGCRSEAPHHRGARLTGANTGCHGPLTCVIELLIGDILDTIDILFADAEFAEYGLAELLGHVVGVDIEDGAAHDDSLVEESAGLGHAHQGAYLATTTRLAEDSHVLGVTTKLGNVVAHPLQGLHYIEHADIA